MRSCDLLGWCEVSLEEVHFQPAMKDEQQLLQRKAADIIQMRNETTELDSVA